MKKIGFINILGKSYLLIGSSIIIDKEKKSIIVLPTMLLPQNVSNTNNAYYTTMAILYNILINKKENIENIDILFTSICCGYRKMKEEDSIKQILKGIADYKYYLPNIINNNIIVNEPSLYVQPKFYQNTDFFEINSNDIIHC